MRQGRSALNPRLCARSPYRNVRRAKCDCLAVDQALSAVKLQTVSAIFGNVSVKLCRGGSKGLLAAFLTSMRLFCRPRRLAAQEKTFAHLHIFIIALRRRVSNNRRLWHNYIATDLHATLESACAR
jgi:hypothetical protein